MTVLHDNRQFIIAQVHSKSFRYNKRKQFHLENILSSLKLWKITVDNDVTLSGRLWNWYASVSLRRATKYMLFSSVIRQTFQFQQNRYYSANLRWSCSSVNFTSFPAECQFQMPPYRWKNRINVKHLILKYLSVCVNVKCYILKYLLDYVNVKCFLS